MQGPAGVIIEKTGYQKVSNRPSRRVTFGWNVLSVCYPTCSEMQDSVAFNKSLSHSQKSLKHISFGVSTLSWNKKLLPILQSDHLLSLKLLKLKKNFK